MPQLERGAFEGTDLYKFQSQTNVADTEVRMTVFSTDDSLFREFIDATYDSHVYKWEASHPVGSFTVTRDEWTRYAYTALRSRLGRVNDEHGLIRSDDEWQIPSMIATILNGVGRVFIDSPITKYVPVWNAEYDSMVMERNEWLRTTAKLRALASDRENAKFVFVRNLTGDRSGDPMIMDLVPVRDTDGTIRRLGTNQPIDGVAAFVYLAMGFLPDAFSDVTINMHPKLLPQRYFDADVARHGATELGLRSA